MSECIKNRLELAKQFRDCRKAILALGDEIRQQIILTLLENEQTGMRVGEISKQVSLSRPAVSHHLQVLKKAKIISVYRKGTMNFYYINADKTEWGKLTGLMNNIYDLVLQASKAGYPGRVEEEEAEK
ncbi:MAG: ArsR/SmtB family transcription factor [Ruminococcus sp.]|jgi:DNA-binding transcriptional ArsR family regulator